MKFKDLETGNVLETENNDVIAQYQKYPERYEVYTDEQRRGRPPKNDDM